MNNKGTEICKKFTPFSSYSLSYIIVRLFPILRIIRIINSKLFNYWLDGKSKLWDDTCFDFRYKLTNGINIKRTHLPTLTIRNGIFRIFKDYDQSITQINWFEKHRTGIVYFLCSIIIPSSTYNIYTLKYYD